MNIECFTGTIVQRMTALHFYIITFYEFGPADRSVVIDIRHTPLCGLVFGEIAIEDTVLADYHRNIELCHLKTEEYVVRPGNSVAKTLSYD